MQNQPTHHNQSPFTLSQYQNKFLLMVLGLLLLLRVLAIIEIPFTDTTEARYAEIARKMVETNDWITPQFDYGVPFWGKPPLHTWVSALGMKCFGVNQFGARIFIFATACFMLLLLYQWVRKVKNHSYALLSIVILASSGLFFVAMATVMTDLVMAFGTSLSMIAFWRSLHDGKPRWGYLFFVGLAIGLLAKGPVATVLTALPILLWVLANNEWHSTWKKIPWIKGSLLAIYLTAPWYIAAEIKTPGFLNYFIIGEHFQRFTQSGWDGDLYGHSHARAKGSIWLYALMCLMPWTPFMLAPLVRIKKITTQLTKKRNPWLSYLLCWALSPMLFFTLATNILPTYVITGVPAFCILAVEMWRITRPSERVASRTPRYFFTSSAIASLVIWLSTFLYYQNNTDYVSRKSQTFLISKTNQLRDETSGELFYWKKRYYSADFYSHGEARVIDREGQIGQILTDKKRDFLAIKQDSLDSIPAEILNSFQSMGNYGKMRLFYEKPIITNPELTTHHHAKQITR